MARMSIGRVPTIGLESNFVVPWVETSARFTSEG
ncbi:hypothetical protein BH23PLA1_BH23PLA1_31950 [soil metagenome]